MIDLEFIPDLEKGNPKNQIFFSGSLKGYYLLFWVLNKAA
jgi:hypothetical protein